MELFLISSYTALCIALFTVLRMPLNRVSVPAASIGGAVLVFATIQLLNFYHPYSGESRQYLSATPIAPSVTEQITEVPMTNGEHNLVAWFHQNSRFRLNDGSAAEVTFDSVPGKVFSGKLRMVLPSTGEWDEDVYFDSFTAESQRRIPVLINITDPRYAAYLSQVPDGSHAQTAVYGEQFHELAVVRKTLLRMSAWMNYLTLFS